MITLDDLKLNIDNCITYIYDKYGAQENLSAAEWLSLITEEVGEFATEINDNALGSNFIEEGCQICATTLCAMVAIFNNLNTAAVPVETANSFIIRKNDRSFIVYAKDEETAERTLNSRLKDEDNTRVSNEIIKLANTIINFAASIKNTNNVSGVKQDIKSTAATIIEKTENIK